MIVDCGKCGRQFKVDDTWAGRRVKCKGCGNILTIPAPESDGPDWSALEALATQPPAAPQVTPSTAPITPPHPQTTTPPPRAPRSARAPLQHLDWAAPALSAIGILLLGGAIAAVYIFLNREAIITNFARLAGSTILLEGQRYNPYQPLIVTLLSMALGVGCLLVGRRCMQDLSSDLPHRILGLLALVLVAVWIGYTGFLLISQGIMYTSPASTLLNIPERRSFNWSILSPLLPLVGAVIARVMVSAQVVAAPSTALRRAAPWTTGAALLLSVGLAIYAYQASPIRPFSRAVAKMSQRLDQQAQAPTAPFVPPQAPSRPAPPQVTVQRPPSPPTSITPPPSTPAPRPAPNPETPLDRPSPAGQHAYPDTRSPAPAAPPVAAQPPAAPVAPAESLVDLALKPIDAPDLGAYDQILYPLVPSPCMLVLRPVADGRQRLERWLVHPRRQTASLDLPAIPIPESDSPLRTAGFRHAISKDGSTLATLVGTDEPKLEIRSFDRGDLLREIPLRNRGRSTLLGFISHDKVLVLFQHNFIDIRSVDITTGRSSQATFAVTPNSPPDAVNRNNIAVHPGGDGFACYSTDIVLIKYDDGRSANFVVNGRAHHPGRRLPVPDHMVWSPDGRRIALLWESTTPAMIVCADIDKGGLVDAIALPQAELPPLPAAGNLSRRLDFLPDSRHLLIAGRLLFDTQSNRITTRFDAPAPVLSQRLIRPNILELETLTPATQARMLQFSLPEP